MKTVKQLASGENTYGKNNVIALCEDGTTWKWFGGINADWVQCPVLPDEKERAQRNEGS